MFLYSQTGFFGLKRFKNSVTRIILERRGRCGLLFQSFTRFIYISTPTLQNPKNFDKVDFPVPVPVPVPKKFFIVIQYTPFPPLLFSSRSLNPTPNPTHSFPNPTISYLFLPPPPVFHLPEIPTFSLSLSLSIPHSLAFQILTLRFVSPFPRWEVEDFQFPRGPGSLTMEIGLWGESPYGKI